MLNLKDKLYISTFQENALETAKSYGLGIEFNHTCISQALDEVNIKETITSMQSDFNFVGYKNAIVHGPFTEIHPAAIDHRARQMAKERLNETFTVCQVLGVNRMVVHTGWMPFIYFKEWQAENSATFWQDFMSDKPSDFNIYIENVLEDEPFMISDMMRRIQDRRIKLCLDTGHANAMTQKNISVEMWIKELAPYISHFHLHNNYGDNDEHGSFESGSMNMISIFNTIESHCTNDVTFTIEARNCLSCAKWIKNNGYL